jgi:hypothetical protein
MSNFRLCRTSDELGVKSQFLILKDVNCTIKVFWSMPFPSAFKSPCLSFCFCNLLLWAPNIIQSANSEKPLLNWQSQFPRVADIAYHLTDANQLILPTSLNLQLSSIRVAPSLSTGRCPTAQSQRFTRHASARSTLPRPPAVRRIRRVVALRRIGARPRGLPAPNPRASTRLPPPAPLAG